MPLRSGINSPQSEVQSIIEDYRRQGLPDEQLEKRLSEEFAPELWEPILHPKDDPKDDIESRLISQIGPKPEEPSFPTEIYEEFKYDFRNPLVKPLMPKGMGLEVAQMLPGQTNQRVDEYNAALKKRNDRATKQSAVFELYNNQVEEYNYNAQSWNEAAEAILEDENKEFYESTIKMDNSLAAITQLPERVNPYSWKSALGEQRNTGKFSPLDFGTHIFAQKTDAEIHREMLSDEGYLNAMKMTMDESFNLGTSDYPVTVSGSPDDVMAQVKTIYKQRNDDGFASDPAFVAALSEKMKRKEAYESAYMKEWFSKYARENVFDLKNMTPEEMAQAEQDIFDDTGLYINLDGNNTIGVEKEGDFWTTMSAASMRLRATGNNIMFQANAMGKALDFMINDDNKTYESYDIRMDELKSRRQELNSAAEEIDQGLTRYYMTRTEAMMAGENLSLDIDEVQQQSIITVLKGFVGFDDAFSKMERLEAAASIPQSQTGNLIGAAFAVATKGRGAKNAKTATRILDFFGKSSIGASVPMAVMVGADKFAEVYDDPFFSTFTDAEGNEVSPIEAQRMLEEAQFFGNANATFESIGLTRDRNDAAILGYTTVHAGGEAAGEIAGGLFFKGIGKYATGTPLDRAAKKRIGQYLVGAFAAIGISMPEEYLEEAITEAIQYSAELGFEDREFNMDEFVSRVRKAGLSGFTMAPMLGSATSVVGTAMQERQIQQMSPEEFNLYQLRFAYNSEYDRLDQTARDIIKMEQDRDAASDPSFMQHMNEEIAQKRKTLRKNQKARMDRALALLEKDAPLANKIMLSGQKISGLSSMIREAANEDVKKIYEAELEKALAERSQLDDMVTEALKEQRTIVVKDRDGNDVKTSFTDRSTTTEEDRELEGLSSARRPTEEDARAQDELDEEFDLDYDASMEDDQIVMLSGMDGTTMEQGSIDESKMQEGVMDFLRMVAPDLASEDLTIITYGSEKAYEADPDIARAISRDGSAPRAYAARNEDGKITRLVIYNGSSKGDAQHEVGHVVLRDVYDNPVQRTALAEKILDMANMKGNETFRAWVNSTIDLYGSTREDIGKDEVAQEELIQNFFQAYVSGEWNVFTDAGKQIEVKKSVRDSIAEGFWDFLAIRNPSVRKLNIKNTDGLIAVAKKFQRFVSDQPNFTPTTEKVPTPFERMGKTVAAPEQKRPEPKREKLDPASLFKERPAEAVAEMPAVEEAPVAEAPAKEVKPQADLSETVVPTPITGPRQETESEEDYRARLQREADELLKGTEGIETSKEDALSQETEGLRSKQRGKDFVAGKKIKAVYIRDYDSRVFELTAKDYGHYRNWVAKITGNGSQPFDRISYQREDGTYADLRAPKPVYNRDGTKRTMKAVDVRPFKHRFMESRNAIIQAQSDAKISNRKRYNRLRDLARENNIDLNEYIDYSYDEYSLADIEHAEVQILARISEEPGTTYDIGIIGPNFEATGRISFREPVPKDLDVYRKGRELGYRAKKRNTRPYHKNVEGVGKLKPSFDYVKAIDEGALRRAANAVDAVEEVRQENGDGSILASVVKYAATVNGKATYKVGDKSVSITINSGIFTPVAEAQRLEKQLGRSPNPSEVMAVSNTNKGKQSEVYDAIKYRLPVQAENQDVYIAFVKLLEQKNPLGSPEVFEGAFKLIDAAIANVPASQREEALLTVVKSLNKILDSEFASTQTLGWTQPTYDSESNKMIPSKPIKQSVPKKGGRVFMQDLTTDEMGKSTGLLNVDDSLVLDENNPELAYESFKRYFTKAGTRRLSFSVAKPFLEKLFNSNHLSSKKNKKLLGLPNTQEFLEPLLADEFKSANSKSGDIVGMIVVDPKSAALRTDKAKDNPYPFGVTGAVSTYVFDEFATEEQVKKMMEKKDPTAITGGVGSQASGLTGLTSKRRAGRIYHHGRGQWEKSDSNMFGNVLSAVALKLQDKYFDVIMLQNDVENYKQQRVEAGQDFDLALDLMYGKTRDNLESLETTLDMIKDLMAQSEITSDQLSDYLYAKHAPERNAYVASKNPGNKAGSGQTDIWAAQTVRELETPEMKRVAGLVYSIIDNTRKTMVKFGLETQETIDAWQALFGNYVPLAGLATDEMDENNIAYPTGGAGMSVYGSTQKKIKGRKSEVKANIVAQVVMQNAMVIQTARKNEAMMHLYRLIKENPNSNVWGINTSAFPLTRLNEQGQQEGMSVAEMKMNPHTVPIRINGKTEFLYFKNKNYANSLNGMTVERASIFTRGLNSMTGFMRNMLTVYDPNFMISNYARDIQAAAYNAMAEAEMDGGYIQGVSHKKFAKDLMSNMYRSTSQLFKSAAFGIEMTPEMEGYMAEWSADGGKTGWGYTKTLNDITAELEQASKLSGDPASREFDIIMGTPKKFANYIEGINEAFEASTRLAAYIAARQNGISRERAAQLSKNITVNFNRSGEWQFLNSVYLFFNAAMQGNYRFLRSMTYLKDVRKENGELESWHKRVSVPQKIAFAISAFSGLITTLNIAMSGTDPDDGELWYNKIPDYHKERNLIFMHRDGKNYSMIPLPYGYNIFNNFGTVLAETSTGNREAMDGAMFLLMSGFSAFSPIGFGQSKNFATYLGKAAAPTLIKPLVEIAANETYFGSQVYQERLPFSSTPYSQLAFQSPDQVQEFFQWMNEATGGSKYKSGSLDMNPDQIWYLYEYYIGSAGRFVGNTGELATNMYEMSKNSFRLAAEEGMTFEAFEKLTSGFQGDNRIRMRPSQIPIIRKIYGEPSRYFDSDRYKENTFEIQQLKKELEKEPMYTPGRYTGVQELDKLFKETNKALKTIRAQRRMAKDIEDRTERINRLYELDERQRRVMTIYNRRHEELRGKKD